VSTQNYSRNLEIAATDPLLRRRKGNTAANFSANEQNSQPPDGNVPALTKEGGEETLDEIREMLRSNPKVTKPLKLSQMIDVDRVNMLVLEGLVQRPISSEHQILVRCDVNYTRIGKTQLAKGSVAGSVVADAVFLLQDGQHSSESDKELRTELSAEIAYFR
jgi:hypothetical protein